MIQAVKDNPADPVAVIIGGLGTIASVLHVPRTLGLDADDMGAIVFTLIAIAGAVRALFTHRSLRGPQEAGE